MRRQCIARRIGGIELHVDAIAGDVRAQRADLRAVVRTRRARAPAAPLFT
jgi:hypothetical protein